MRRIVICSGVLGGGTALVFALAAMTASLFPNGTVLRSGWPGMWMDQRVMAPIPMPAVIEGPAMDVVVNGSFPEDTTGGGVDAVPETPTP